MTTFECFKWFGRDYALRDETARAKPFTALPPTDPRAWLTKPRQFHASSLALPDDALRWLDIELAEVKSVIAANYPSRTPDVDLMRSQAAARLLAEGACEVVQAFPSRRVVVLAIVRTTVNPLQRTGRVRIMSTVTAMPNVAEPNLSRPDVAWRVVSVQSSQVCREARTTRSIETVAEHGLKLVNALAALGIRFKPDVGDSVEAQRCGVSERELSVLVGMSDGKSNAEIGRDLYVSEDTVKTHARRLFKKLAARDRAHAVRLGAEYGLLNFG